MAEFEATVAAASASGLAVGKEAIFYKNAAGRLVAPAGLVFVTGAADNRIFIEVTGDAANGLDVDVTRLPADPLGLNADVVVSAGNAGSISGKLRQMSADLDAIKASLQLLDNGIAGNEFQVDIVSGGLTITRPATAAVTTQATSSASAQLKASNGNRLGLVIWNDSDGFLYLKFGGAASTSDYTERIDPRMSWANPTGYTGAIHGVQAGADTGTARVTELTA